MFKRLTILISLISLFSLSTQAARADEPPGAKLYSTFCAACHGVGGIGGFARAIGDQKYLSAKDDIAITQSTAEGIPPKGMPAWSKSKGGTLSDDQIGDIVAYLRALDSTAKTAPASSPTVSAPQVYIQTKLAVKQSANAPGDAVLHVTLQEYDGNPVGGATIAFTRPTLFGAVDLGTVKTDLAGNAAFDLNELPGATQVIVRYKGEKNLDPSDAKITVARSLLASASPDSDLHNLRLSLDEPLLPPEGSLITPNPPLLPTTLFALVVLGVWTMYAYVFAQIVGIWRQGASAPRTSILRWRK
ncbi:MAG: cytochrome c [Chloroflexi bacterium]|nr:cytochrome c [Chloroflexota bacterium]